MEKSNIHVTDILAVIMLLFMRIAVSEGLVGFLAWLGVQTYNTDTKLASNLTCNQECCEAEMTRLSMRKLS
jgi:hypothetical protein